MICFQNIFPSNLETDLLHNYSIASQGINNFVTPKWYDIQEDLW